jgi:hypothetical protein
VTRIKTPLKATTPNPRIGTLIKVDPAMDQKINELFGNR